jgi:hypothetical protein
MTALAAFAAFYGLVPYAAYHAVLWAAGSVLFSSIVAVLAVFVAIAIAERAMRRISKCFHRRLDRSVESQAEACATRVQRR